MGASGDPAFPEATEETVRRQPRSSHCSSCSHSGPPARPIALCRSRATHLRSQITAASVSRARCRSPDADSGLSRVLHWPLQGATIHVVRCMMRSGSQHKSTWALVRARSAASSSEPPYQHLRRRVMLSSQPPTTNTGVAISRPQRARTKRRMQNQLQI